MRATHLVFPIVDRDPAASTRAGVRAVVTALLGACAGAPLLAFHLSDSHLHVLAAVDRAAAGRLARRIRLALRSVLGPIVGAPSYTTIRDPAHLANTFEYVLRNDEKHQVVPDPWRENSALPDLLGLRVLPSSLLVEVRRALPRVTGAALRAMAGWGALSAAAPRADTPTVDEVVTAATAVLALPGLSGQTSAIVEARRAVVQLLPTTPSAVLQAALGRSGEAIRRLRSEPVPASLLRAVGLHLSLQAVVPLAPPAPFPLVGDPTPWTALPRYFPRAKPR